MKRISILLVLFVQCCFCNGQNLVPNPSFEEISDCPQFLGDIDHAVGWFSCGITPDLYHTCYDLIPDGIGVPTNGAGHQYPQEGEAYAGIVTYTQFSKLGNEREFMITELEESLEVDQVYEVSFYVSRADTFSVDCATNGIGARFTNVLYDDLNPAPVDNFSHLSSLEIIYDKNSWTPISGTFISDSSYQYLVIGNFLDDEIIDTAQCASIGYYYVDNVCVHKVGQNCTTVDHIHNTLSNTAFYPNPAKDFLIVGNNQFDFVEIRDFYGQECFSNTLNVGTTRIDLQEMSPGIYQVHFSRGGKKLHSSKLIVTN